MNPKVAVVLPVYNCIEHLPSMIEAFYNSTDYPFKLIIVDAHFKISGLVPNTNIIFPIFCILL